MDAVSEITQINRAGRVCADEVFADSCRTARRYLDTASEIAGNNVFDAAAANQIAGRANNQDAAIGVSESRVSRQICSNARSLNGRIVGKSVNPYAAFSKARNCHSRHHTIRG